MSDPKSRGEFVYNGMVMNRLFPAEVLDRVPTFQFHPNEIMINTYPKSGTTWLQQITWLIMNKADVESARKVQLAERSPFLEINRPKHTPEIDKLEAMDGPRIIKSHLGYSFFKENIEKAENSGLKIIVCIRNIKDVIVSYYNFCKAIPHMGNQDTSFDEFFNLFKAKQLIHGDYFDHTLSWWTQRENPNIYFVTYEDMKLDPRGEIERLATFLGKNLTDSELKTIVEETSFASMKANPSVNQENNPLINKKIATFIRKGEVGDWQNYFSEEQRQYVDDLVEGKLAANGLIIRDK